MAIKFLRDHIVDGPPREAFQRGQVVKDRNDASELHFVRRGAAAYLDEKSGKLTDHDGNPVTDPFPKGKAKDDGGDQGDGLDKKSAAQLAKIVKDEGVTVPEGADQAGTVTAIRAHREACKPASDGLDDLDDAALTAKVTETGIAVEPGADRPTIIAALREHAKLAANGQ